MPQPSRKFERLNLPEFLDLLAQFPFRRRINAVHMHHTFRPNHAQYRKDPEGAIVGMWRFHTQERKFSDIAQHITIGPDGEIWLGRNWDLPPASATGHNGNLVAGPFMFEMIGDFDTGGDPFQDPQRDAALRVVAHVQHRFRLSSEALRFHNQMSSKTCPGTQLTFDEIVGAVKAIRAEIDEEARAARFVGAFGDEASPVRAATRRIVELYGGGERLVPRALDEGELNEEDMSLEEERALTGGVSATRGIGAAAARGAITADEMERLAPHIINLRFGAFSGSGNFKTRKEDVDRIFDEELPRALAAAQSANRKLKVLFYAHGGLKSESGGLVIALDQVEFWRRNGVYPIFFVWETGLLETASDLLRKAFAPVRGVLADVSDSILEAVGRPAGRAVWGQMKRSAEVSVLEGGGALYVAQRAAEFSRTNRESIEIHAAGHSAGSIFQCHFLPALVAAGSQPVKTVHFLAPAVSIPLFRNKLVPLVGSQLGHLTMYTMKRGFELDDTAGPYQKSLLYLVRHSFEEPDETPILGLEEDIRADREMARFFGLAGGDRRFAEVIFSVTDAGASPRSASQSTTHGGFDNDQPTMNSFARRVLDVADSVPIFGFPKRPGELGAHEDAAIEVGPMPEPAPPVVVTAPPEPAPIAVTPLPAGKRKALCVGINAYPSPYELGGCVADAKNWASALENLGFETTLVLDGKADRATILGEVSSLILGGSAGDVVVFQFAGHGTTLKDVNGDEDDASDEALCPVDFSTGAFVIDDDLREIFAKTPAGVNVTCFIDCCHSGTITRLVSGLGEGNAEAGTSKRRFIRATRQMEDAHRAFRTRSRAARAVRLRGPEEMHEVLFSACLPSEVAYESEGNGDFTSRAVPILRAGGLGMSNVEFQQKVTAAFGMPARQHPNMDCAPGVEIRPLLQPLAAAKAAAVAGPSRKVR